MKSIWAISTVSEEITFFYTWAKSLEKVNLRAFFSLVSLFVKKDRQLTLIVISLEISYPPIS